jgi:hypothetical protein
MRRRVALLGAAASLLPFIQHPGSAFLPGVGITQIIDKAASMSDARPPRFPTQPSRFIDGSMDI